MDFALMALSFVGLVGALSAVWHVAAVRRGRDPVFGDDFSFYVKAYLILWAVGFGLSFAGAGVISGGCARLCSNSRPRIRATGASTVNFAGHLAVACGFVGLVMLCHLAWTAWGWWRSRTSGSD